MHEDNCDCKDCKETKKVIQYTSQKSKKHAPGDPNCECSDCKKLEKRFSIFNLTKQNKKDQDINDNMKLSRNDKRPSKQNVKNEMTELKNTKNAPLTMHSLRHAKKPELKFETLPVVYGDGRGYNTCIKVSILLLSCA